MKERRPYYALRLLLGILSAVVQWSCTHDELPLPTAAEDDTRFPLTLQVEDAGFAPDSNLSTRTLEGDCYTRFTIGDSIGVYVSRESNQAPYKNLLFVRTEQGWKNPDGQSLWYEGKNSRYYAYYPYRPEGTYPLYENEEANIYFNYMIRDWTVPIDQSTYEKYAAADLMVCRGELTRGQHRTLTFTFVHQMTMLEIDLSKIMEADPSAKVTYHTFRPWQPNPEVAVYRYLFQPKILGVLGTEYKPVKDLSISVASQGLVYDFEFTGISDQDNRGKYITYRCNFSKK